MNIILLHFLQPLFYKKLEKNIHSFIVFMLGILQSNSDYSNLVTSEKLYAFENCCCWI